MSADFSKEDFANEVLFYLNKADRTKEYAYSADTNRIEELKAGSDQSNIVITLDNLYRLALDLAEEERATLIRNFFEGQSELRGLNSSELKSKLRFRGRTREEISIRTIYASNVGDKEPEFPTAEIGELLLEVVLDLTSTVHTLTSEILEKLALKQSEIYDMVIANMSETSDELKWEKGNGHFWVSSCEDEYASARLISLYPRLDLPISGKIVAYMPSHTECIITDVIEPNVLKQMVQRSNSLSKGARFLSFNFWTFEGGGWVPLEVKRDDQVFDVVNLQYLTDLSRAYNEQTEQLYEKFKKNQHDTLVARFNVLHTEGEGIRTVATYPIGWPTILPKVEAVFIGRHDIPNAGKKAKLVYWDEFVSILGEANLVEYEKLYPIRYDLVAFPHKKDLAKIRQKLKSITDIRHR